MVSPSQLIGLPVDDTFAALRTVDKSAIWNHFGDELYYSIRPTPADMGVAGRGSAFTS